MTRLQRAVSRVLFHNSGCRPTVEGLETRSLLSGDVAGTVYNDANNDGQKNNGENGIPGWTVFVDLNNNGSLNAGEPSAVTNVDGDYLIQGVAAGPKAVKEILPFGWVPSTGTSDVVNVVVINDTEVTADFFNHISTTLVGSIEGIVWQDLDGDGIRATEPGTGVFLEPGLANWTIFIDTNDNRVPDAGELTTVTDASGLYSFSGLVAGTYKVNEVLQAGWEPAVGFGSRLTVDLAPGEAKTGQDFANVGTANGSVSGFIWSDVNNNGLFDGTDAPLQGWEVYLDLNENNALDAGEPGALSNIDGNYQLLNITPGEYKLVEVVQSGWEIGLGSNDSYTVFVTAGVDTPAPDFSNHELAAIIPGTLTGTAWEDLDGDAVRDAIGGVFTDPGLAGWRLFVDTNLSGTFDAGEKFAISAADGSYTITGITPGTIRLMEEMPAGWRSSSPAVNYRNVVVGNNQTLTGLDFGTARVRNGSISGTVFADTNASGTRDPGERGLNGITVFLDLNGNTTLDAGEPSMLTSEDLYFTPTVNEAGVYSFTHLPGGTYTVRTIIPATLSATPGAERSHTVTLAATGALTGIDTAARFRLNEIRGIVYNDLNRNHLRDPGEPVVAGRTVYIDLDRDNTLDPTEPTTITAADGSYLFAGLTPGSYVVRIVKPAGWVHTYPETTGGVLWPAGVSNPSVGNVTPTSITVSLAVGQSHRQNVSLTLPTGGALTNKVDVFLLFDDTGSFTSNSPIVRAAFPAIMLQLQASLPGIDLGFGVGRFEEYGNFAAEYATGRPFILNQPIVSATTPGYLSTIQSALDRTTPGYGGDTPETDIEALFQLVTGRGFDGNNNGSVQDSGPAGLGSTQLNPGTSGDVPSFASFTADPASGVINPSGNIGGGGFRPGALPIILTATDTGFAYQPKGETSITGTGGLTLPVSALTQFSRSTTPFNYGAGLQETITGLNALGALVIGLGTNAQATLDPRQGLEALAKLTGAVNRSVDVISNGTADPIAPGDPLYFQIASGFGASVANGIVTAIQSAVTDVAVDITLKASDPRVHIINHTGTLAGIGAGQTATFDVEFIGDGAPRRFDLQFVRAGTDVVVGSIPVVLGTPIPGDGYEFEDCDEGEITIGSDFGEDDGENLAPHFVRGADQIVDEDSGSHTIPTWATSIFAGPDDEAWQVVDFVVTTSNNSLFSILPTISPTGSLSYTLAPNANGQAVISVTLHDNGGTLNGGVDTSASQNFSLLVTPVNDAPVATADLYGTPSRGTFYATGSGVLTNDLDVDGDVLTVALVSGPRRGALTLNPDGTFAYTRSAGFIGTDTFTYRVSDGTTTSGVTTVTLKLGKSPIRALPVIPPMPSALQYDLPAAPGGWMALQAPDVLPMLAAVRHSSLQELYSQTPITD
jgi:hypothetical protein